MNTNSISLKMFAMAAGAILAFVINAFLGAEILSSWQAMSPSLPTMMAVAFGVMMCLAVVFVSLTIILRAAFLMLAAVALRGRYAFRWLPRASFDKSNASRKYFEWSFVHKGQLQMGMYIGRLQVVLYGVPVPYPTVSA